MIKIEIVCGRVSDPPLEFMHFQGIEKYRQQVGAGCQTAPLGSRLAAATHPAELRKVIASAPTRIWVSQMMRSE